MKVITEFTENKVKEMSNEQLSMFIPDVYQEDILDIDYGRLWENGIRLLSFDIDDTIMDMIEKVRHGDPKRSFIDLFVRLKECGFTIVLLTNSGDNNARRAFEKLNKDGCLAGYISDAAKPAAYAFQKILNVYGTGLDKSQMAHIGNSMRKDVQGGNCFGITTCLVKDIGKLTKLGLWTGKILGINEGHWIRHELKERGLWRKHHKDEKGDQYYQLGEKPAYMR